MKSKKAQTAIEGMIIIGIIFFVFLIFMVIYQAKSRDVQVSQRELNERADCWQLSNSISSVFMLGPAAQMNTKIYSNTTVYPYDQRIETNHTFCTMAIPYVSNNSNGVNNFKLKGGGILIQNQNKLVVVTNG